MYCLKADVHMQAAVTALQGSIHASVCNARACQVQLSWGLSLQGDVEWLEARPANLTDGGPVTCPAKGERPYTLELAVPHLNSLVSHHRLETDLTQLSAGTAW